MVATPVATAFVEEFWGKTNPGPNSLGFPYKPVIHHILDVAAVALRLQQLNSARTRREALLAGVSPEALVLISAFLAGLHDLGKFSRAFQWKVREYWPVEALGPCPGEAIFDRGHWRNSMIMLCSGEMQGDLGTLFPNLEGDALAVLWAAVAGHHGRPPGNDEIDSPPWAAARDKQIGPVSLQFGLQALRALRDLVSPEPIEALCELEQAKAWSWRLAGLTNVADWVGSDSRYFKFLDPQMPLPEYWNWALEVADDAIRAKGLASSAGRAGIGLKMIAPGIARPRPMQQAADAAPLGDGPLLFIVEDTTGSGKTEAALSLAGRMIEAGKAEGLYFALPTMATANAMYGRLAPIYRRLFVEGATPSLVLAHGRADLSQDFTASVENRPRDGNEEDDAAAWCAEWIADSRRKAFFADIGAGTVDQAFLSVLQKKFLTLRQYGLAGRILLIDEAHAFDAYMFKEMETLLTMHAMLGGSAIVLSATLPQVKRCDIAHAFRLGLGIRDRRELDEASYPLLTSISREGVVEAPVSFDDELQREVAVEFLPDAAPAHELALQAARQGAAVLVIRNAVDEAIASYTALKDAHADTQLFHARFAMCDRQGIETDALERFGRDAEPENRAGRILVATQVVEQSLDLDFDLVISDLAPVDLIIQRAGRLWRHMDRRPEETRAVPGPRILVISPYPDEATSDKWLEPALGKGAAVYSDPAILYRTAMTLFESGKIRTPQDLRPMIERVYGGKDEVPQCLQRGELEAEGRSGGQKNLAQSNVVRPEWGYHQVGDLSPDQEIGTRLGEDTVTLRLARRKGGRLVPWATPLDRAQPGVDDTWGWAMSEVTVREKWLGAPTSPAVLASAIGHLHATWPEWERAAYPVAVVEDDGRVLLCGEHGFTYSTKRGFQKRPG
jgi:CRISPR-associated endonuclease/helicase Cas3